MKKQDIMFDSLLLISGLILCDFEVGNMNRNIRLKWLLLRLIEKKLSFVNLKHIWIYLENLSAAGHNWLKSIIEKLWTRDFWRVRIGVDRPATKDQIVDWVLSSFKPNEKELLVEKQDEIFNLIDEFLTKKK